MTISTIEKKSKLGWYDYISSMAKAIKQGTEKGTRRRQRRRREDNMKDWVGLELGNSVTALEDGVK